MLSPPPFLIICTLLLLFPLSLFFSIHPAGKHPSPPILPDPPQNASLSPPLLPLRNDDKTLLRLASFSNPNPTFPPKIAFLFLTTTPLPFSPLWERFFSPENHTRFFNIYIHADPTHFYASPFSGVFADRVIPSKPTRRSHHSLIAAARRLLAYALLDDPSNAAFALLSPTCIPLRSFGFVYRTLAGASAKSFIEILAGEPGIEERYFARGLTAMLPDVPFEDFRVGSQFFALTRRHAVLVANDTRLWARFKRPCLADGTCYPEEHYFPTLLSMRDPDGVVPATLTNVDWTGSVDGHPRMYGKEEVGPGLIDGLRQARPRYGGWNVNRWDPFLFARKFSPECLEPLMGMADDVIFRDGRRDGDGGLKS